MKNIKREFGKHYIVELIDCDVQKMRFVRDVEGPFLRAAKKSGTKIVKSVFHQFHPQGVTGVIIISWSHFAIHTWPEAAYIALDILTCGEMDAEIAVEDLKESFGAKKVKMQVIPRGF